MSQNDSDLAEQEPRGCRYVFGDPGTGPWFYCQKPIIAGGKPGDSKHPPYCETHTAECCKPAKPFKYYNGWEKHALVRIQGTITNPDAPGFDHTIATDVYMHLNNRGLLHG